jgi:CheY-like chemotaxis protein
MDGGEVLRRLRANDETRKIAVVMLTAVSELVDERLRAECTAFLEKPCDPDRLVQAIEFALAARGRRSTG